MSLEVDLCNFIYLVENEIGYDISDFQSDNMQYDPNYIQTLAGYERKFH